MYDKEIDEDDEIERLIAEGLLTREQQNLLMTARCYDMGYVALHGFEPIIKDLKHPLIYDLMIRGIVTSQEIIDRKVPGLGHYPNLLSVPEVKSLVENLFITVREVIWASETTDYYQLKNSLIECAKTDLKNNKTAQSKFRKCRENIAFSHLIERLYLHSKEAKEFEIPAEENKINKIIEIKYYIEQILNLRNLPLLPRIQNAIAVMLPELLPKSYTEIRLHIYEWIKKENVQAFLYNTASVFANALKTPASSKTFNKIGTPLLQEIIADSVSSNRPFSKLDKINIIKRCYEDIPSSNEYSP